jgi:hypothetical protein
MSHFSDNTTRYTTNIDDFEAAIVSWNDWLKKKKNLILFFSIKKE